MSDQIMSLVGVNQKVICQLYTKYYCLITEQSMYFMLHFMVTLFKICFVWLAPLMAFNPMPRGNILKF